MLLQLDISANYLEIRVIKILKHRYVLIDQQRVGTRSLYLMNTVNAKKSRRPFTGSSTIFDRENHIVTRLANEWASFLNMNDIKDVSFFGMNSVSLNANCMVLSVKSDVLSTVRARVWQISPSCQILAIKSVWVLYWYYSSIGYTLVLGKFESSASDWENEKQ
jgi:hypothetical protein